METNQEVPTLKDLIGWVLRWDKTCRLNNVDPANVPLYIENNRHEYYPFSGNLKFGSKGVSVSIEYFDSDIVPKR